MSILALLAGAPVLAQSRGETYTLYGVPGLIEMPSAIGAPDGEISGTVGYFGTEIRNSFTFQITPRLSGTFRYAGIDDYAPNYDVFYDRSFDLSYRFTDEGDLMPMLAIGMRDVLGTGVYASEYIVATKTISDSIRVTGGLGWGRLGTYNGFGNPLGFLGEEWRERPPDMNLAMTVACPAWVRGSGVTPRSSAVWNGRSPKASFSKANIRQMTDTAISTGNGCLTATRR